MISLVIIVFTRIIFSECIQEENECHNVNKLSSYDVDVNKESEESLRDWIRIIEDRQFLNKAPQSGSLKKEIKLLDEGSLKRVTMTGGMTILGHFEGMCLQDGLVLVTSEGAPCEKVAW